jgi:epoxide hydrolase-like predicted phosphatase
MEKKRSKSKKPKIKKPEKIKAIIFDIGGVLFLGDKKLLLGHQDARVHEILSKKYNLTLKEWFKILESYEKSITGEISKKQVLKKLSKKLPVSEKKLEKDFLKAYKKTYRKNKQLFKHAKKLKKQGYLVGILSDQSYFSYEALIKKKYFRFFSPKVISFNTGYRKPEKEIYQYLKKELDDLSTTNRIKYSEIIFIDNRDWNLKPAKKLGMKTILYKNNKQTIKKLNELLGV